MLFANAENAVGIKLNYTTICLATAAAYESKAFAVGKSHRARNSIARRSKAKGALLFWIQRQYLTRFGVHFPPSLLTNANTRTMGKCHRV